MTVKRRTTTASPQMGFWDTSAIVPLCFFQPQSAQANQVLRVYRKQITWWATTVEAITAVNRLYREHILTRDDRQLALNRLSTLRKFWHEIQPSAELRDGAERLLSIHQLRAADALQLSAALVWSRNRPRGRTFIAFDESLADAAEAEGFTAIRLR
jgi:predicted nucleic acid-binding protein